MKKQYINLLILSASLAIIALIGIQIYWVQSAISLKEDEFKRNANQALINTADFLEKEETMSQLKTHQQGRYLFIDDNAEEKIIGSDLNDSTFDYKIIKQYNRQGDDIEYSMIEEKDGQIIERSARKSKQNDTTNLDANFGIDLSYIKNQSDPYLSSKEELKLNNKVRKKIADKKAFVGDIVKSLMEVNLFQPIDERVNVFKLDSLLNWNLKELGITTRYEFGVYDNLGKLKLSNLTGEKEKLDMTTIQTKLFPNDMIGDAFFLKVYFPRKTRFLLQTNLFMLVTSGIIMLAIIYLFYWTLNTIVNQKRNSEIKNDFINNMTHEFKTPISTISLACEAMSDPDIGSNQSLTSRYIGMIVEENKRLGLLVEEILQSAVLDKGTFKLKREELSAHNLIEGIVDKVGMKIKERNGQLNVNLNAELDNLEADRVHLANVVYNLIDNANKYSKEQPEISISTTNKLNEFVLEVSDRGIGISRENQKKVFDKLYRVPTGNLHDVKGFGLGLSYVKIIVERHGGRVSVKSQLGKGSTFTIYLPLHGKV